MKFVSMKFVCLTKSENESESESENESENESDKKSQCTSGTYKFFSKPVTLGYLKSMWAYTESWYAINPDSLL